MKAPAFEIIHSERPGPDYREILREACQAAEDLTKRALLWIDQKNEELLKSISTASTAIGHLAQTLWHARDPRFVLQMGPVKDRIREAMDLIEKTKIHEVPTPALQDLETASLRLRAALRVCRDVQ